MGGTACRVGERVEDGEIVRAELYGVPGRRVGLPDDRGEAVAQERRHVGCPTLSCDEADEQRVGHPGAAVARLSGSLGPGRGCNGFHVALLRR